MKDYAAIQQTREPASFERMLDLAGRSYAADYRAERWPNKRNRRKQAGEQGRFDRYLARRRALRELAYGE